MIAPTPNIVVMALHPKHGHYKPTDCDADKKLAVDISISTLVSSPCANQSYNTQHQIFAVFVEAQNCATAWHRVQPENIAICSRSES